VATPQEDDWQIPADRPDGLAGWIFVMEDLQNLPHDTITATPSWRADEDRIRAILSTGLPVDATIQDVADPCNRVMLADYGELSCGE
jgi:hypothetical protein